MSTGVVAPPREHCEEWWEGAGVASIEPPKPKQPARKIDPSGRAAVSVLEDALDLAVEAGLTDWEKRRVIDSLITRRFFHVAENPLQVEALGLIDRWEAETSRLGSMQAAKRSDLYRELLNLDSEPVIRAALERLSKGSSPHVLVLLGDVAGAVPAATETTVDGAVKIWLDWGSRQGMI